VKTFTIFVELIMVLAIVAAIISFPEHVLHVSYILIMVSFLAYIILMALKSTQERLPNWLKIVLIALLLPPALLLDTVLNWIVFTIILLEKPRWGEWLLTSRLKRVKSELGGDGPRIVVNYRLKVATALCRYALNPWDEHHC
jgi:hypothetical protein